jgi:hypothetical protein
MPNITDSKNNLLQSIFRNKLSDDELRFYTSHSILMSFDEEELLCSNKCKKIYLIIKGNSQIKDDDELIMTLAPGCFIGLSYIFTDDIWRKYEGYSTCGLQVLCFDITVVKDMMTKFPALRAYFYETATKLDLTLIHYRSTKSNLSERVGLPSVVSSLERMSFAQGIYEASLLKQEINSLILYKGELLHTSGIELEPGRVYDTINFPDDGEWVNLTETHLFYEGATTSLLSTEKTKKLETSKKETLKLVEQIDSPTDSINTVSSTSTHISVQGFQKFIRQNWILYMLLLLVFAIATSIVLLESTKCEGSTEQTSCR